MQKGRFMVSQFTCKLEKHDDAVILLNSSTKMYYNLHQDTSIYIMVCRRKSQPSFDMVWCAEAWHLSFLFYWIILSPFLHIQASWFTWLESSHT